MTFWQRHTSSAINNQRSCQDSEQDENSHLHTEPHDAQKGNHLWMAGIRHDQAFICSSAEYCAVVFHSRLNLKQEQAIENIQSTCLWVILNKNFISYEKALLKTGLKTFKLRRQDRCLSFILKCIKHPLNSRFFPKNHEKNHSNRSQEVFAVNHANNNFYRFSYTIVSDITKYTHA